MLNLNSKNMKTEYFDSIINKLDEGNLALFIGSGFSTLAGLPDGSTLTNNLKTQFSKINQDLSDFMDICDDIVDTPPYNRQELMDFVKLSLSTFKPSEHHLQLTKYNWATIFTSNFDNVIEVSYNLSTDKLKPCIPVIINQPSISLGDRKKLFLFKIMGCINASTEDGEMVLSKTDFHQAIQKRNHYLKLLSDIIKNGTVLYLGYSFKDKIVTDIIKDLKRIHGVDKLPWCYWLSKDDIPTDEKSRYFFSNHKILPIKSSIENFLEALSEHYASAKKLPEIKKPVFKLNLKGKIIGLDEDIVNLTSQYFTVLSEELVSENPGEKDLFLMGTNNSWGAFMQEWDFKRAKYSQIFKDIINELEISDTEHNKIFQISGMPGVGKSFLIRRIAFDIYIQNNSPVLYYNNTSKYDFKAITSFLEEINKKYDNSFTGDEKVKQLKYTFIFDDAAIGLREIIRLKDYLTSRGRQVLIIVCDRENEWQKALSESSYSFSKKYECPETIEETEVESLMNFLFKGGYIQVKNDTIKLRILEEYEKSFFAIIYSYVHPSKKPLNEIIKDQYNHLNELSKKTYQYICCFSQFNIPLNVEWLVRILNCPYQDFIDEVIKKDAVKIIFELEDLNGNLLYKTHHRIIAQKTIDYFLPDSKILYDKYSNILDKVEFSNIIEKDICEKFLIRNFSVNSMNDSYDIPTRIELFKIVCKNQKSRTVLHHLGLLELEKNLFIDAEIHLREALEYKENFESYRGESDQNILTSLGKLYSRQAINNLKEGKKEKAEEQILLADSCFREAKHGEYPNVHAYHSHAYFWFKRGMESGSDDTDKLYFFGKSIEILNDAKDNINPDELLPIYTLEQEVWNNIGITDIIDKIADLIKTKFNSAKGYFISSLHYYRQAKKTSGEEKEKHLKLAFRKTEKALNQFPQDDDCLHLRCKIYKEFKDFDIKVYFSLLHKWYLNNGNDNVFLLFELGRTAFILEYFDLSNEVFSILQSGIGMGNNLRMRPQNPITENDKNKKFLGEITDIFSKMEGFIKPHSFSTKYKIPFRPVAAKYTTNRGDYIVFEIAFNFRGAIALNVMRK